MADIVNAPDEETEVLDNAVDDSALSMSDDDFLNGTPPVSNEPAVVDEPEKEESPEVKQEDGEEAPEKVEEEPVKEAGETTQEAEGNEEAAQEEQPINYEENYKKLMAPFKANGKEIKLDKPEDLIKLAQMGANYTKKMQALQPHMKMMRMLENHGLADEGKLNFLIDLYKKDPKAIQQLVKDSGIDPLDIDSESKETYKPNNYAVPDAELAFSSTVTEVRDSSEGQELINEVGTQWDKESKEIIWTNPDILRHMTAQRQTGIYQTIVTEIERQKMLGELGNVPFVQAYLNVGTALQNQGKLANPQQPRVVDTRAKEPAPVVRNDAKARSAAPIRQTQSKPKQDFNPLAMSDDDFMNSDLAKLV